MTGIHSPPSGSKLHASLCSHCSRLVLCNYRCTDNVDKLLLSPPRKSPYIVSAVTNSLAYSHKRSSRLCASLSEDRIIGRLYGWMRWHPLADDESTMSRLCLALLADKTIPRLVIAWWAGRNGHGGHLIAVDNTCTANHCRVIWVLQRGGHEATGP